MYLNKHEKPDPFIAFLGLDFNENLCIIKIYEDDSVVYERLGK